MTDETVNPTPEETPTEATAPEAAPAEAAANAAAPPGSTTRLRFEKAKCWAVRTSSSVTLTPGSARPRRTGITGAVLWLAAAHYCFLCVPAEAQAPEVPADHHDDETRAADHPRTPNQWSGHGQRVVSHASASSFLRPGEGFNTFVFLGGTSFCARRRGLTPRCLSDHRSDK